MQAAEQLRTAVVVQPARAESADAGEDEVRRARERADTILVPLVHARLDRLFHRNLQANEAEKACCPVRAHMIAQLWTGRAGGFGSVSAFTTKIIHLKFLARAMTSHELYKNTCR